MESGSPPQPSSACSPGQGPRSGLARFCSPLGDRERERERERYTFTTPFFFWVSIFRDNEANSTVHAWHPWPVFHLTGELIWQPVYRLYRGPNPEPDHSDFHGLYTKLVYRTWLPSTVIFSKVIIYFCIVLLVIFQHYPYWLGAALGLTRWSSAWKLGNCVKAGVY